jgi:hypothetical protein
MRMHTSRPISAGVQPIRKCHTMQATVPSAAGLYPMPTKSSIPYLILSTPPESIKPLISIPNKRQTQRALIATTRHLCLRLRPQLGRVVDLRDLVDREVLRVDIALQFWFERSANFPETIPLDAVEEGVTFDVSCTVGAAEAVGGVGDETIIRS